MDPVTVEQIKKLHAMYPAEEDRSQIEQWEKELKSSSLFINLREHAAFKIICDRYYSELAKINKTLQDDETLFKPEGIITGRLLHERKRFIKEFFRPFEQAKVQDAYTRKKVYDQLNQNNENTPN